MLRLKSLGLSIVTTSVLFCSQAIASVPDSVLNKFTDLLFWTIHPEMHDRKIQPNQTQYQKEWLAIREVLKDKLIYSTIVDYCASSGYLLNDSEHDPYIALADAIFYTHHPELTGHKIKPSETRLREEWNAIFKSLHWEEDAPAICVDK
jgi:hypothetical protein